MVFFSKEKVQKKEKLLFLLKCVRKGKLHLLLFESAIGDLKHGSNAWHGFKHGG